MSKFNYMNFGNGVDTEFVAHAGKFTREDVLRLFNFENKHLFEDGYRKPTISDIKERAVRYYPIPPLGMEYEFENGCYSYARKGQRGSFPVWVIYFEDLEEVERDD